MDRRLPLALALAVAACSGASNAPSGTHASDAGASANADAAAPSRPDASSAGGDAASSAPDASPSGGGKLSFSARPDGVSHVFVMNVDGSGRTQLTSGPYDDVTPEWSPDGSRLVFGRSDDGYGIYVMDAAGANVQRLSPSPGRDLLPSWSADGQRIVFTRIVEVPDAANAMPTTDLMIMDADGANARTVFAHGPASPFNMEPRFSPDGTRIVFMCGPHGPVHGAGIQVCLIDADGTNLAYLTDVDAAQGDPHWSHDGKRIAFGSNRDGNVNIYVMNADGSAVTQLTDFVEPIEAGDTGWSPDDTEIAFEWDDGGMSQSSLTAPAAVWLMTADGSNQHSTGVACADAGCGPRFQP